MSRLLLIPAFIGLMFATPSFAATMVSDVAVKIDLPAVTNKAAALRFTNIADDVKYAITALLVGRLDKTGEKIDIRLSEVELSNSYAEVVGTANTRLVGVVSFANSNGGSIAGTYTLTVDVDQAKSFLPAAIDLSTLSASSDEYYNALIQAFATTVVAKLPQ